MGVFEGFFSTKLSGEVISSLIVMAIIAVLAIIVGLLARFHDPLKKPKGLLLITEMGVEFFDNFTTNLVGRKLPGIGGFIMAVACYLFISFIFGLTGLPSPVTCMAVPVSLGLTTFLGIHLVSAMKTKWSYFKRYIDPFPFFLPVNLISMWAPLLSLSLRLFGNAVAGWTLMTLIYSTLNGLGNALITYMGETLYLGGVLAPLITSVLHAYFDLFSGFIQTTVFISLTTILLGQEVPEEDEE